MDLKGAQETDGVPLKKRKRENDIAAQTFHDNWLASVVELAIEPDMPIVDPHHHLWDKHPSRGYARRYLLQEIAEDCAACGHHIVKTVYVQSSSAGWQRERGPEHMKGVGEVEVMQGIASMSESGLYGNTRVCAGIIGTVDLLSGVARVEEALREHMKVARNFRGVRFRGANAESIPWFDTTFRAGVAVVDRLNLVLDVTGPQIFPLDFEYVLGGIADLARAFPTLTIVVDHCGGAIGPKCFETEPQSKHIWEGCLAKLEHCQNVMLKVGGLHMSLNAFPLGSADRVRPISSEELAELTRPYLEQVIRVFGVRRCMFESNFPMDKWGVSYGVLWNSFKRIVAAMNLSADEKRAIFHDTAVRTYRL